MTLAVEKVEDHKYKSWKDSSNLKTAKFNQNNIIFGHNGSGKSSLANGIAKVYLSSGDKEASRFFSGKYVENTLLLEDKSGIRGIVSNFGEKDVDIEKKVDANNKKIQEFDAQHTKQTSKKTKVTDEVEQQIKEVVKRRKDKNKKINNKPDNKTVQEKITLWVKDYDDSYKIFPDEDYNAITGNADFSAESEQLNLLEIPAMPPFSDEITNELTTIFATEYKNVAVPEHTIVDWLQSGLHIHEGKEQCEFCGAKIDMKSIKERVNAYLNDEKHQATVTLDNHKDSLVAIKLTAEGLIKQKDSYKQVLGLGDTQIDFDGVAHSIAKLSSIITGSIDTKIKSMNVALAFSSDELSTALKTVNDAIDGLEKAKKHSSQSLTDKINRLEILVKGAIGLEIKNSRPILDNLTKIEDADTQIKELDAKIKKLEEANDKLLAQKSDLADFAQYLNTVLKDLGLNFILSLSNNVYVLKHTDGASLKMSDISDGERNLLSLIYFYYEMFNDSSGAFKDIIKLIVIDDPISSLDDGNKFYITELVRSMLEQASAQIFVLTHSWDDFCNLAYGRNDDETSLFQVRKESGISNIYDLSNKKLLKPYIMLYREVDDFRQKDLASISDDEALHMPNTMRRVLEEYVKFQVNVDFATASSTGDISKALFKDEIANLSETKKRKLNQLLAVCNILSHKANQPKNPSEVHESAKFLITTIEQHDKFHHLKMRGD